jgi:hypothetical protein
MNHIRNAIKAVKKAWLEFQLQRLEDRQALADGRLFEANLEVQLLGHVHDKYTTALARKRTALRTKLIRL